MGAGVEEIVRLFAGHLHLSTETARVRLDYDKFVTAKAYQDPDPHKDTGNYKKPDDLDDYSPTAHRVDPSSVAPNSGRQEAGLCGLTFTVIPLCGLTLPDFGS